MGGLWIHEAGLVLKQILYTFLKVTTLIRRQMGSQGTLEKKAKEIETHVMILKKLWAKNSFSCCLVRIVVYCCGTESPIAFFMVLTGCTNKFEISQWGPMLLKWNFRRFWFLRWHFICLHISWKSAKGFGFILFCLRERAILLKLVFWESIIFYIIFVVFISKNWGVRIHF